MPNLTDTEEVIFVPSTNNLWLLICKSFIAKHVNLRGKELFNLA